MKNTKLILFFVLTTLASCLFGQETISPRPVCNLPSAAQESSGIYVQSPIHIWTHNDSGGTPQLFQMDTLGKLLKTWTVENANNVDWEETTSDATGTVYIGDFGNNFNFRQDLKIYKIPNFDVLLGDKIRAEVINFSYEDQKDFPPSLNQWYFDAEAMLAKDDSLYVLTRDRTQPYIGLTRIYRLPKIAGTHVAKLVGIYPTNNESPNVGSISSAAISPDRQKVVMQSYSRLWVFQNFGNQPFWKGKMTIFKYNVAVQREGIGFLDNCNIYITEEKSNANPNKLYTIDLCKYLTTPNQDIEKTLILGKIFPNPTTNELQLAFQEPIYEPCTIEMFDMEGGLIFKKSDLDNLQNFTFPDSIFPTAGLYFCQVKTVNGVIFSKKIIKY